MTNFLLAPIHMIRDIRALGGAISRWGAALNIPQLIGGLIFISTPEGVAILLTEILCLLIAGQIHRRHKFSRLISLCHIPWLALLPWLVWRVLTVDHPLILTLWLFYVIVTIAVSLAFDIREVLQYRKGDKVFAWAKGA